MRSKIKDKQSLQHILDAITELVYEYFGIDIELIWQIIVRDIPALKVKVTETLQEL